jgi:N-carbamoylputrescine amidase
MTSTVLKTVKIGLIQQKGYPDKKSALAETYKNIQEAVKQGAELILLQELHAGYYFCQTENSDVFDQAETIPGETTKYLSHIAKEFKIVLVGSIFEKRAAGIYHNTAVVFERDGTIAGKYRKMHIPDDPGYYEKYYFAPGDLGFKPIQTSVGKLGVLVCWDQWYPEAARIMALNGAEILLYPTAIGWFPKDSPELKDDLVDAWVTSQRGHSIANCLPVAACNRVGYEADPSQTTEGILFWGNSFITNAHGKIKAQASRENAEILVAEIDMTESREMRHIWPYFRDRRIDAYQDILCRYCE